jgi:hypothetical protein
MIAPARMGNRSAMALLLAIGLLALGGVALAMAAGLIPGFGGGGAQPHFQAPGPQTYTGRLRQGNGADIHVPRALVPPTIDGDLADWDGSSPNPVPAPYVTLNPSRWAGPSDLSADFFFAWDADNFYVGAVVTDNTHVQFQGTRGYNLYYGDDIEIWFDTKLNEDFGVSKGDGDDYQLGLSPGNFGALTPEAVFWNPNKSQDRNKLVRVAAKPRALENGYTLEAAVPWAAFGDFRPQAGQAIGFAASAGDNDQPNRAQQEVMISTVPALRYKEPPTYGNLFF